MAKVSYRIKNWKQYNRSLINRGNLNLWISQDTLDAWYEQPGNKKRARGRPCTYSMQCLQMMLTLRSLFSFPLRATQGFVEGLFVLLGLKLMTPCYSQLSRRAALLNIRYHSAKGRKNPTDLVIDSTGLKIYGEGEWKMRTHGKQKRRTWRKLHLAMNANNFQTVAMELTEATVHDDNVMPTLLQNQKKRRNVYGDGAYLSKRCFDAIVKTGAKAVIPVRSGTSLVKKNPSPGQSERNRLLQEIWSAGGRSSWKKTSTYHKRSLVETQMYRFKTLLGPSLNNRCLKNQIAEAQIKMLILNQMTKLGMPRSYRLP